MKKAYCVYGKLNEEAKNLLISNGIELTENSSKDRPDEEGIINLLSEYDVLIVGIFPKLTAKAANHIKTKKIIASSSIGLDHIDKAFFESPLVKVVNIKLANTVSVAEHIFSLILALNKRVYEGNHLALNKQGHRNNVHERPEDISNKTLGLIGAGNITVEVIKIANIFNMKIKSYTNHPENHQDLLEKGVKFVSLDEVLKESDIINVSIPLNDETRNLISKDKIQLMKPTATFVNTSRTEIVDTNALIEYADLHDTFYVGLDIDLDEYEELFSKYRANVIVTPHTAGISKQATERMDLELADKIVKELQK